MHCRALEGQIGCYRGITLSSTWKGYNEATCALLEDAEMNKLQVRVSVLRSLGHYTTSCTFFRPLCNLLRNY